MRKFSKVCLVKGGVSGEREISLSSGQNCYKALKEIGYETKELDFNGDVYKLVQEIQAFSPNCIFNALHGGSGENGEIQGLFNLLKIPYTHSGVAASSIAMNKSLCLDIARWAGIKVPEGSTQKWGELIKSKEVEFDKFVIKPVDGGSSLDVYILNHVNMLNGLEFKPDQFILLERFIPGLELTVGVMGERALAVTELKIKDETAFYDYHHKYSENCTIHELPADIPNWVKSLAMNEALRMHSILGCRGISRSDFRYDVEREELYFLELNTQPGFSDLSLVPEQAKYLGISFNELVEWVLEEACYD